MAIATTGVEPLVPASTERSPGGPWAFRASMLFALVWWSVLVLTWLNTANPPVVSRPQLLAARVIVAGTIRATQALPRPKPIRDEPMPPFCRCQVTVVDTLHGMPPGDEISVIVPGEAENWTVGRSAIWPLVLSAPPPGDAAGEVWLIVNLPQQRSRPLVYPDLPAFRTLIRDTLDNRPLEAELGEEAQ
jgi:hypothetical protein